MELWTAGTPNDSGFLGPCLGRSSPPEARPTGSGNWSTRRSRHRARRFTPPVRRRPRQDILNSFDVRSRKSVPQPSAPLQIYPSADPGRRSLPSAAGYVTTE